MNNILLFFVLPISTIILAIVLQKILKCPILVGGTFFAIFLIVTYAIDPNLLIFAIAYTILAYITAIITTLICNIIEKINLCCNNEREGNARNGCIRNNCICNNENSCSNNNSISNANSNQARFTLTTNQTNPVLFLTNQSNNQARRNNCCCGRR